MGLKEVEVEMAAKDHLVEEGRGGEMEEIRREMEVEEKEE